MKKIFRKTIGLFLALVIIVTTISPNIVMADNENYSMDNKIDLSIEQEAFAIRNSGIDLISINFERQKMNLKEERALDELLELMYKENKDIAKEEGYSKKEYKEVAEYLLSADINSSKISVASDNAQYLQSKRGLISTKFLGGILNGVITATLAVAGVGTISQLIKKKGKAAAKAWVQKYVKKAMVNKLKSLGLGTFAIYAGNIISGIVDAYVDPGGWLARKIDARDKIPRNGYIELW